MLLIRCPWCGARDETEFRYGGQAHLAYPTDPEAWFVPPYVGPSGWVGAVLSKADGDEVRELIVEAWRMTAPKRKVAAFDEGTP